MSAAVTPTTAATTATAATAAPVQDQPQQLGPSMTPNCGWRINSKKSGFDYKQADYVYSPTGIQPCIVRPECYSSVEATRLQAASAKDEQDIKEGTPPPQLVTNRPGVSENMDHILSMIKATRFKVAPTGYPLRAAYRTEPCIGLSLLPMTYEEIVASQPAKHKQDQEKEEDEDEADREAEETANRSWARFWEKMEQHKAKKIHLAHDQH